MRLSLFLVVMVGLMSVALSAAEQIATTQEPSRATIPAARPAADLSRLGVIRFDALGTDTPGDVCFMLRTYRVEREQNSDATRVVAEYKCQHASKFTVRKAAPRNSPQP